MRNTAFPICATRFIVHGRLDAMHSHFPYRKKRQFDSTRIRTAAKQTPPRSGRVKFTKFRIAKMTSLSSPASHHQESQHLPSKIPARREPAVFLHLRRVTVRGPQTSRGSMCEGVCACAGGCARTPGPECVLRSLGSRRRKGGHPTVTSRPGLRPAVRVCVRRRTSSIYHRGQLTRRRRRHT